MPKSNVGKSSELTVYSFLQPYYTFCNIIPLFLRGYYWITCSVRSLVNCINVHEVPCFVLLTCTWLLRGLWFQSQLDLLDQRQTLGNVDTKFSPSPHHSAESALSYTSSANTHSSVDHIVTGDHNLAYSCTTSEIDSLPLHCWTSARAVKTGCKWRHYIGNNKK
jgi:hypothetical protein